MGVNGWKGSQDTFQKVIEGYVPTASKLDYKRKLTKNNYNYLGAPYAFGIDEVLIHIRESHE